ncbi:MAG: ATP-binding protein [Thermodesulfovibrionales bacterium]|nr:ATP-binding protein [Thermodesulfovibrionales bacterium]
MMTSERIDGFFTLRGGEFNEAGKSATGLKKALREQGYELEASRRAAVVAFEAEMNVIIHAVAGTLQYSLEDDEVKIVVIDMGPGIPDVAQAMKEGFSTAPEWAREHGWGSGLGLPNIKKNSDRLVIDTVPGEGTKLEAVIRLGRSSGDGSAS